MDNKPDTTREKCLKAAESLSKVAYLSSGSMGEREVKMSYFAKKCSKCKNYNKNIRICESCAHYDRPVTVFERLTASPEVLAEKSVYRYDGNGTWRSFWLYGYEFLTKAEAIAATVARLREVATAESEVAMGETKHNLRPFCKNEIDVPKEFWAINGVTVSDKIRTLLGKVDELTMQVDDLRDDIESIHIYYNDLFTTL